MRTLSSAVIAALSARYSSGIGSTATASGKTLDGSGSASAAFWRAADTAARTSSSVGSAAQAYPRRSSRMTRTPPPRDSANVIPSTSPRSALTSVRRSSSAKASTCSPSVAAPSAACTSSWSSDTRASDGDLADAKRRRSAADGSTLAVLAADAFPRLEVGADCVHGAHHVDRASDQVRAAHRRRDLAVLDQVPLRHTEHEVAARRIGLAAAETRHIDPRRGVTHDRVRIGLTGQDVRVRHPHDRRVGVGLTPRVAGGRGTHPRRSHPVLQEPLEHAVGEQDRALRWRPLVVEVIGAPAVRDRGVVDAVDELARAALADQAAVDRGLLVDRVGLERMTDGLVEQDPAAAVRDDDRHLTGRRRDRIEHRDGPLGPEAPGLLRRMDVEELDTGACRRTLPARLDHVAALRDDLCDQPDPRAVLLHPPAVARRDQPPLHRVEVDPGDLRDLRTHRARRLVDGAEPADLRRRVDLARGPLCAVRSRTRALRQIDDRSRCVTGERGARRGRGLEQRITVEPVRVGVAVRRALEYADAGTTIESRRELFDAPVVEPDRCRGPLFDEDLRDVTASAPCGDEYLGHEVAIEHARDGTNGCADARRWTATPRWYGRRPWPPRRSPDSARDPGTPARASTCC